MSVLRFFFVILRGNFIGMTITELQQQYAAHPNMAVMKRLLKDTSVQTVFCGGLCASAASLFSSVLVQEGGCPFVFILGDLEEAGYFYHDLTQILGTEKVLFFPSSFRRSIKYGQKDAANEILRTEVLSRLQKGEEGLCIVTYPDALAEKVVSRKELSDKTLKLNVGEKVDTTFITDVLHSYGFEYVDYVYEPGQYAVRGSIIDVFSFASEYPYRIDFFARELCSHITIRNNFISNVTNEDWGCVGIGAGYVRNMDISHNEVCHLNYSGICVGWGWTSLESGMCNNRIEANYVHHFARRLYDAGGLYTLSNQPGSVMRNNRIEHLIEAPYATNDRAFYIYLDEATDGYTMENNWCPAERFDSNRPGKKNVWKNNGPQVADSIKYKAGRIKQD